MSTVRNGAASVSGTGPVPGHSMVGGIRDDDCVLWRTWLGIWPDSGDLVSAEEFVGTFVREMAFSVRPKRDDYFAVVVGDHLSYAMYARAGATAWKTLRDAYGNPVSLVHDVVHVEGGRFLAMTQCHGKVLELDLAIQDDHDQVQNNRDVEEEDVHHQYSPSVSMFSGPLALAEFVAYFARGTDMHVENHLVLVDGELYQIWASWVGDRLPEEEDYDKALNPYHIAEVGVVRCDLEQSTCWSEVADLGGWAVLVGRNETVAMRVGDMPGLRASCVYFIDSRLEEVLCAFNLRSGQAVEMAAGCDLLREAACSTARSRSCSPPPVWYLPSLK